MSQIPWDDLSVKLRRIGFETQWGPACGIENFLSMIRHYGRMFFSKHYWVAKAFPTAEQASGLLWLYPDTKFVYIHRNGIDVVHSMTKFGYFKTKTYEALCEFWAQRVDTYRYLTSWEQAITIRHSDLVNQPDEQLQRIFDFLGIEYDLGPADYTKSTVVHPLDKKTRVGVSAKEELCRRGPSYEDWSEQQRATFKRICADGMKELGYEIPF